MSNLPTITDSEGGSKVVSAREFYLSLGLDPTHYQRWIDRNLLNNEFAIENLDYSLARRASEFDEKPGNFSRDYAITIDFAKRLAMLQRNEFGEKVRKHFVKVEKLAIEATEYHNNQLLIQANERVKMAQLDHSATIRELGKYEYISIAGVSKKIDINTVNEFLSKCEANNTIDLFVELRDILDINYDYLKQKSDLSYKHGDVVESVIHLLSSAIRPDTPGKGVKVGY